MQIKPITFKEASEYIEKKHRHHKAPRGWKFGTSLRDENGEIIGVVVVGRPVARAFDDGATLEVTRLCTDGTENACSKLYGVARRVAFDLGYDKVITYTLSTEEGASLRGAGWNQIATTNGGTWDTPSRRRIDKAPTIPKYRWETVNPKTKSSSE